MRKVSKILTKSTCDSRVTCGPCYAPEGPCSTPFDISTSETIEVINYLGGANESKVRVGNGKSCISYEDALNKATYEALKSILDEPLLPDWGNWDNDKSSEEISFTSYCACGLIGDPVTVTKPANAYTDYWTIAEANLTAWLAADDESFSLLVCTPP